MFKNIIKLLFKNNNGQALVMVALAMTALLGFTALTVDYGNLAWQKRQLQNSADAAALAGAQLLPNTNLSKDIAKDFASRNGFTITNSDIETPYNNNNSIIKVSITKTFSTAFARALKINESSLTASAVAQKYSKWDGEALPFINLSNDYTIESGQNYTKIGTGAREVISDFYTEYQNSPNLFFAIEYLDGVTLEVGFSNGQKGLDHSKLKDGLEVLLNESRIGSKYYILSLKADVIQNLNHGGTFKVIDKHGYDQDRTLDGIKAGDVVDPSQIVLLECELITADWNNNHNIEFEYTGKVYDIMNGDFPEDYINPSPGKSRLIK